MGRVIGGALVVLVPGTALALVAWTTRGSRSAVLPLSIFALTLLATGGFVALAMAIRRLRSRLAAAEREHHRLAGLDPLTQLAGRPTFELALEDAVALIGDPTRGRRTGDATGDLALIMLDLDGLAAVNAQHGREAGDGVLRAAARLLSQAARPGDTLARVGGDEFAVVAPGAGSAGAHRLAEALEIACARVTDPDGEPLGATVAWALHPSDGTTAAALLDVAADRLTANKRGAGRRPARTRGLVPRPGAA
jgi:diguanylate cyclase (GGDEF)-like protein